MSSVQNNIPMIPVIDELLVPSATAPAEHKKKVQEYNEMLEDIYQREVELTRIKSHLLSMRDEIVEEAQIYGGAEAMESIIAASTILNINSYSDEGLDSDSASGSENNVLSDGTGSTGIAPYKAAAKASKPRPKIKGTMKSKGTGYRRSKVPDAQLGASWDYRLDVNRGGRRSVDEERPEL
ncbi:hypothetical protein CVT24_001510 [Panaeolus cyanescens]|uniref:Uncharacterized protein n=1 Tax=Panaeolus cyanescens TaxID=181874 RepID=A0A409YFC2_9AGAR|nr:hypothetical protein CVT24_001510 [Panaeolus cyanescens]